MARSSAGSPPSPVIFDSDVLIHYLRGRPSAVEFLREVPFPRRKLPAVAYMELLQGAVDRRELNAIRRDLRRNFSEIVLLDEAIAGQALRLMERHALPHGLRVADALIAATALVRGFELATANERHYRPIRGLRLRVYRP